MKIRFLFYCLLIAFVFFDGGLFAQLPDSAMLMEEPLGSDWIYGQSVEQQNDQLFHELTLEDKININHASSEELSKLPLNDWQILALQHHLKVLGDLISIYELQSIPYFDNDVIRKLLPYITVVPENNVINWRKLALSGKHSISWTTSLKSADIILGKKELFSGSPLHHVLRYRYDASKRLQYSFLGEKDPGETLFKGASWRGFDFYSANIHLRDVKGLKQLMIGDFMVNMGQGLIHWQGLSLGKSSEVLSIKRQSECLRPYHGTGVAGFHRGLGFSIGGKQWQSSGFFSLRRIDAILVEDSNGLVMPYVSSILISGLHRTELELARKNTQVESAAGVNFRLQWKAAKISMNAVLNRNKYPWVKQPRPENIFFPGLPRRFGNLSFDWAYTGSNYHFFGEAAVDMRMRVAFLGGILCAVSSKLDLSMLLRALPIGFQTYQGLCFSEKGQVRNEKGFFLGCHFHPVSKLNLSIFYDQFIFPWLSNESYGPLSGAEFGGKLEFKPTKNAGCSSGLSFKWQDPMVEISSNSSAATFVKFRWRTQLEQVIGKDWRLKIRADLTQITAKSQRSGGHLFYMDIRHKPLMRRYSWSLRYELFHADDDASRVFAFERDATSGLHLSSFAGDGAKGIINVDLKLSDRCKLALHTYLMQQFLQENQVNTRKMEGGISAQVHFTW